MFDFVEKVYHDWLYTPAMAVVKLFESEPSGIYILLAVFIVLASVRPRLKMRILPRIIDIVTIITFILLLSVAYLRYGDAVKKFFKEGFKSQTPASTTTTSPSTNTQTTPTVTTPGVVIPQVKQLYYTVSCSSCWNESCPRNGYSYGGYTESIYMYYYQLCKGCSCNSFNAVSFWK